MAASASLRLGSGMLLAVPIPTGQREEGAVIEAAVQEALAEVERRGISGNEVMVLAGNRRRWRASCSSPSRLMPR